MANSEERNFYTNGSPVRIKCSDRCPSYLLGETLPNLTVLNTSMLIPIKEGPYCTVGPLESEHKVRSGLSKLVARMAGIKPRKCIDWSIEFDRINDLK